MLLALAVGDAYGAGFEYADEMVAQYNDLSRYVQHPRHTSTLPGMYTDDTQMSIAITELILSRKAWTPHNIAEAFLTAFKRDEREGYAQRFYQFLLSVDDAADFLERIQPTSDKSGAAMRATPLGIFASVDEVLDKCRIQATVTHDTADGIQAAQAAALMSHYFIHEKRSPAEVGAWLEANVPGNHQWDADYQARVGSKGLQSVRAAVTAVKRHTSLAALLQECIAFTGDVDTVATIALGAASNSAAYTQDLPVHLVDSLENGAYGADYLRQLDAKLQAMIA